MDARAARRAADQARAASTTPEQELQHALAALPNYARAEAGLGAVAVARGDLPTAERWYKQAAGHLPLAEILVALGDVQTARGETAAAKNSYALVSAEQNLFRAAGGNADLELALFDADHGDEPRPSAWAASP